MQKVRLKNTDIEHIVRRTLHGLGYRFRLHRSDLPGKPDITLSKYKTVVFVHGCFWHGHDQCPKGLRRPKRNATLWAQKIDYNRSKDARIVQELTDLGWTVIVVWECETKEQTKLVEHLLCELNKK